jgi:methyl-accepting chemotaxis protein
VDWLGMERRRLGTGMLVFGVVGLVIAGMLGVGLIAGAFAARDLDQRLEVDQARIADSLHQVSESMSSLAATTEHAGDTLTTSGETIAEAKDVLASAASTAQSLSESLNITILGGQPFARASDNLGELSRTLTAFQDRADALAANLDQNASDASGMADKVRRMQTEVDELATRVEGFDRIGEVVNLVLGGIVLGGLMTAWVAVAAGFCAWAGWRLRRHVARDALVLPT